jgi:hypothetical protein
LSKNALKEVEDLFAQGLSKARAFRERIFG